MVGNEGKKGRRRLAHGALSEIAFALKFGRPVVGVGAWRASGANQAALPIRAVDSAEEAVAAVLAALCFPARGR